MEEVEKKSKYTELKELIGKIDIEMQRSRDRQIKIDEMRQVLYDEVMSPMKYQEKTEEMENAKKDKADFDERNKNALIEAKKAILQLRQDKGKEYQEKNVEAVNEKKKIDKKLLSMKQKGLPAEKLLKAEEFATEAKVKVDEEIKEIQQSYSDFITELEGHENKIRGYASELGVKNEIDSVTLEEKKEEQTEPEQTEPEQTEPEQTEPEQTEPEQTEPEQTESEEIEPEQIESEEIEPEEIESEEIEPEEIESEEIEPEEIEPEEIESEEIESEEIEPEEIESEEIESEEIESEEIEPEQTEPEEIELEEIELEEEEAEEFEDINKYSNNKQEIYKININFANELIEILDENDKPILKESEIDEMDEKEWKQHIEKTLDMEKQCVEELRKEYSDIDMGVIKEIVDHNITVRLAYLDRKEEIKEYIKSLYDKEESIPFFLNYDMSGIYETDFDRDTIKKYNQIAKIAKKQNRGTVQVEKDPIIKRILGNLKLRVSEWKENRQQRSIAAKEQKALNSGEENKEKHARKREILKRPTTIAKNVVYKAKEKGKEVADRIKNSRLGKAVVNASKAFRDSYKVEGNQEKVVKEHEEGQAINKEDIQQSEEKEMVE